MLISRKTQRLYVWRALRTDLRESVTIAETDRPIGTHVFTAVKRKSGETSARWTVRLGG
ncbi:hypothetical protein QMZ05_08625 [Bradyrhizobium sp. INPA03-11B]|uniref:hypothetical protein n=1 Tax=Bradyrhizobium sp. INPA03-11B TaxID=418598 RepID=UPI0033903301